MIKFSASRACQSLSSYFAVGKEISAEIHNTKRVMGAYETDKRLVYEHLRDHPKGLTVCAFLKKIGKLDDTNKLRYRPRFSDLCTEGLVAQAKTMCSVCNRLETLYLVVEEKKA